MDTSLFDYQLPPSRIARFPAAERTASRLLALPPDARAPSVLRFGQIGDLLRPGDLLVANDTRVVPARLFARKPTGGKVEILLERILERSVALVQLRAGKPVRAGQRLLPDLNGANPDANLNANLDAPAQLVVTGRRDEFFVVESDGRDLAALFQSHGAMPLPPYIERPATEADFERYQTVYARARGAVAAPTAGLHFDRPLIARLRRAGIRWATITLHTGAGTFQPVRGDSPADHAMHREWIEVGQRACDQINRARAEGGRVIAVGTTVVRALESAACFGPAQRLQPFTGDTELFILPGYRFRAVDALITNFHLPRSTLLMLVCAFAGFDKTMAAYRYAIDHDFRFYSYGDAMFAQRQSAAAAGL